MSEKPIIISGSGLSSLILARMVRTLLKESAPILIVEQAEEIGGQFRSFNYGQHGVFDHGMHIYYECCIPHVDTLFTGIFGDDDWEVLVGNRKDIAGLFVNGSLQLDTPYVDLRKSDPDFLRRCISELLLHVQSSMSSERFPGRSAYDVTRRQFGEFITDHVFVPIFDKLYQRHPRTLDELATHLTAVNRVALFDSKMALELMNSEPLRSRICYPDQLNMPDLRASSQRGFYPKQYGMFRAIDRLREILEHEDTHFITSSRITELITQGRRIASATIRAASGKETKVDVDRLYWTSGNPPLATLLGIDLSDLPFDRNNKETYYVNFLFEESPAMGELYYFYAFERDCRTFRVTNYTNYCPAAALSRGYPVCVELWVRSGDPTDHDEIVNVAREELVKFGVVQEGAIEKFSRVEKASAGGFPLPSIVNVSFLETARDRIAERLYDNLQMFGVYSSNKTFFIKDVLTDAYWKLMR
jgi:protoporphyrinogen oxidase